MCVHLAVDSKPDGHVVAVHNERVYRQLFIITLSARLHRNLV